MTVARDRRGAELLPGDQVRRVGKLRSGALRDPEDVLRISRDGRSVLVRSVGEGVKVIEWLTARSLEKVPGAEASAITPGEGAWNEKVGEELSGGD